MTTIFGYWPEDVRRPTRFELEVAEKQFQAWIAREPDMDGRNLNRWKRTGLSGYIEWCEKIHGSEGVLWWMPMFYNAMKETLKPWFKARVAELLRSV